MATIFIDEGGRRLAAVRATSLVTTSLPFAVAFAVRMHPVKQSPDSPLNWSIPMKYLAVALLLSVGFAFAAPKSDPRPADPIPNKNIDINGYLKVSQEAALHRSTRRLSENDFMKMSAEPNTIILDARSAEKFGILHIKGAINLSFSDIDVESLKRTLPDKNTRILIYCNNHFNDVTVPAKGQGPGQPGGKVERPFVTKLPTASLNISTYIALYNYGYRNIYELGPQLDVAKSKLPFESNVSR